MTDHPAPNPWPQGGTPSGYPAQPTGPEHAAPQHPAPQHAPAPAAAPAQPAWQAQQP
ncbi:hypothetical protein G6556_16480, partial [Cellulomonas sp. IC4_254]|nr:hypothetical protein [Cellulomonas sp. IC4_254]